jgi:hypothetical protein
MKQAVEVVMTFAEVNTNTMEARRLFSDWDAALEWAMGITKGREGWSIRLNGFREDSEGNWVLFRDQWIT